MTTNQKSESVIIAFMVSEVVRGNHQVFALESKDFPGMRCIYKKESVSQGSPALRETADIQRLVGESV